VRKLVLLCGLIASCKSTKSSSAIEVTDRAWQAHELVVRAGEHAPTCAAAGLAMQRTFDEHRQAFVEAVKLDNDPERLAEATSYLEANEDRYSDLEARMEALSDRCSADASVQAVFQHMETP
jgi:hypothetical protein